MTRKMLILMVVGIMAVAMPGAALALQDGMGDYIASDSPRASASANTADMWSGSGPVETGAVPQASEKPKPSPLDTFYDPFHPNQREVDRSTGG